MRWRILKNWFQDRTSSRFCRLSFKNLLLFFEFSQKRTRNLSRNLTIIFQAEDYLLKILFTCFASNLLLNPKRIINEQRKCLCFLLTDMRLIISLLFIVVFYRLICEHLFSLFRQKSPTLYLADSNVSLRDEGIKLLHEILANKVRKVDLVKRVVKHGQKDLLKHKELVHITKRLRDLKFVRQVR